MSKVALVLGSGARVGQAIIDKFSKAGYKVASVSRTPKDSPSDDIVHYSADLSDPTVVGSIFDKVQKRWGAPSVVIYNAYGQVQTPNNPLSAPIDEFTKALNINTVTSYAAAALAVKRNSKVTFIFTGNALSADLVVPSLTVLGLGKSAASHWVHEAATEKSLRPATFYYADQRDPEGKPCYTGLNGPAHANLYLKLAEQVEQGEALIVFRAPLINP